jgi:hypothetical protein
LLDAQLFAAAPAGALVLGLVGVGDAVAVTVGVSGVLALTVAPPATTGLRAPLDGWAVAPTSTAAAYTTPAVPNAASARKLAFRLRNGGRLRGGCGRERGSTARCSRVEPGCPAPD